MKKNNLTGKERLLIAVAAWYEPKYQCVDSLHRMEKPEGLAQMEIVYAGGWQAAMCRNHIIEAAKTQNYDYVLFIDGDQIMPKNLLINLFYDLAKVNGSIISAVGRHSNLYESSNILLKDPGDGLKNFALVTDLLPGVHECYAMGFGAVLCDTKVFEKLTRPYFSYIEASDTVNFLHEDVYFAQNCEKAGIKKWYSGDTYMEHLKQILI